MPTPTKKFLHTTVRIEAVDHAGRVGTGTSFIFQDAASPPGEQLFLVTNKHVVTNAETSTLYFTRKNDRGEAVVGEPLFVKNHRFAHQWHSHPDAAVDVAVMPLSWQLSLIEKGGQQAFINPVTLDDVADPSVFQNLDVTAPVTFVGFPNGMFDEENYLPIFRRGYVATAPDRDFNGDPVFLIDASVFPGSSGSPVFTVGDNTIGGTPALKFLGIVAAVYTQPTAGRLSWPAVPTAREPIPTIDQMIDLGVVFKARCVHETLVSFRRAHSKTT